MLATPRHIHRTRFACSLMHRGWTVGATIAVAGLLHVAVTTSAYAQQTYPTAHAIEEEINPT